MPACTRCCVVAALRRQNPPIRRRLPIGGGQKTKDLATLGWRSPTAHFIRPAITAFGNLARWAAGHDRAILLRAERAVTFQGPEAHTVEMFFEGQAGRENKTMEIRYTRA